jgi:hypothetical protein
MIFCYEKIGMVLALSPDKKKQTVIEGEYVFLMGALIAIYDLW